MEDSTIRRLVEQKKILQTQIKASKDQNEVRLLTTRLKNVTNALVPAMKKIAEL